MILEGKIWVQDRLIKLATEPIEQRQGQPFAKSLDVALLQLCHQMDVPLPIWLSKNTREFVRFRQTVFFREQFVEPVNFDQFQIKYFAAQQEQK